MCFLKLFQKRKVRLDFARQNLTSDFKVKKFVFFENKMSHRGKVRNVPISLETVH